MRSAIVFGANGYLGRHICFFLKQNNIIFLPIGLSKKSKDNYENYLSIDITDQQAVNKLSFDVDYVFMFAGLTGTKTDKKSEQQYTLVNEKGLTNVLDNIVQQSSRAKVVFPSTRLVYKGVKKTFLDEGAKKEAKTIYAQNKLNCENILNEYQLKYNIKYTIYRICVPYGNQFDEEYSYGTIGFFLSKAKDGKNITLYGDGDLSRTFTHVNDISKIIFDTCQETISDNTTYNIGSNDNLSLNDVAALIAKKYNVGIDYIDWPADALKIESGDTIFSDKKIKKDFDISYQHSIKNYFTSLK